MKKSEIIAYLNEKISDNAYRAVICEQLERMGFDASMMSYHKDIHYGKAFAFIETLDTITNMGVESTYHTAVTKAFNDIKNVDYDVVKMLYMAGFDGKVYYELRK